jgi:hypothetical protein
MQKSNFRASGRASLLFGPAPILESEDSKAYNELLACVSEHVKPRGIIEEIWVRDIVDLSWEILRYRRWKTSLIAAGTEEALKDILSSLIELSENENEEDDLDTIDCRQLAREWVARDRAAIK